MPRILGANLSATRLLVAGAVAPVLFVGTFLVLGVTRAGYDPSRHFVSQLSTGDGGWIQIANFIVSGALLALGAIGLRRSGGDLVVPALIAAVGVGMILAGVFVADAGGGYPPGNFGPLEPTVHGRIHEVVSLVVFLALGAAACVTAWSSRASPVWSAYSLVSGVTSVGFFAATIVLSMRDDGSVGLLQRVSIIAGFAWLTTVFLRARRITEPTLASG